MRILLCSSNSLDERLGAAKALIELAAALEGLGWRCRLAANTEICRDAVDGSAEIRAMSRFALSVGRFVERHAPDFDVVDYDQVALPFARARFHPRTLLVARSALLNYHLAGVRIPRFPGLRAAAGAVLRAPLRAARTRYNVWLSTRTFQGADLINVNNDRDVPTLVAHGFDRSKIEVLPLGLRADYLAAFPAEAPPAPARPRIAFIGTFDARKGGTNFPGIVRAVTAAVPGAIFRFLGARYLREETVRRFFPEDLRDRIEIIATYRSSELPRLLSDCTLGVFPSYVEGFGFGVIEMLAASLPVLAYDVPGPAMILGSEWLVPVGDARALASRVVQLLTDPVKLRAARAWARERANRFTWERAGEMTSAVYSERVARLRNGA